MSLRFWAIGAMVCVLATIESTAVSSDALASTGLEFESSSVLAIGADNAPDLLAGSHPYALTATFKLTTTTDSEGRVVTVGGDLEDLLAELPAGLVIDPLAVPRCSAEEFATVNFQTGEDGCPNASAVGVIAIENITPSTLTERKTSVYPIYDLTPSAGTLALFGFRVGSVAVYLTSSVRTGSDYGLTVAITGIPQDVHVLGSNVTFWGVPAESTHDKERGDCIQSHETCPSGEPPEPVLSLPTQCLTPPTVSLRGDSWQEPGRFSASANDPIAGVSTALTACEALTFGPSFHAQTESSTADSPTDLKLHVHIPQSQDPTGLTEANLADALVTLPAGMTINLARAGKLVGCPLEGPQAIELGSVQPANCPPASRIGSASIQTPILAGELHGGVYLAQQGNLPANGRNPFDSLLAVYVLAEGSGVTVKLPAELTVDQGTGQLSFKIGPDPTTGQTFAPQLPLEEIELDLSDGNEGLFVTPTTCGLHAVTASLTPWSGGATNTLTDELNVNQRCAQSFNPSFSAGTVDKKANAYSTFTTTLADGAGEQSLKSLSLTTPSGLQGTLKGLTLCPEPQASLGTCGSDSLIGEATSSLGAGPVPFLVNGGKVYLTGPYKGDPFGLSILAPMTVGPFNLGPQGRPLVVRAAVHIDPITAENTIITDSSGPYSMPDTLEGIPLNLKAINVTINRPEFIFNPTTCAPLSITGTAVSNTGAQANLSTPFQATDCASLPFSPRLRASTVGRPSRTNGIGFDVKIVQGVAGEANALSVKVDLPKQLPSRLTTLQKACVVKVFEANPAGCPPGSVVGTATAVTPILPVPMSGPAYFVSHGGAKFPELVIVLEGYGVRIDLHGETFISKSGVTSSTFPQIPDAPVSSFVLKLPAGKNSALAAHGNLCASDLRIPTTIVAQNGIVIKEDPKITVGGCRAALEIVRHSVHREVATVVVRLPSAGNLVATGKGLKRLVRKVGRARTVTLRFDPTNSTRRFLAGDGKHRLRVTVRLAFAPQRGDRLMGHVSLLLR